MLDTNRVPQLSNAGLHFDGTAGWSAYQMMAGIMIQTRTGVNPWFIPGQLNNPVVISGSPAFWTNNIGRNVWLSFSGGTVTGVSVNGYQWPVATAAGGIPLLPWDVVGFTNSGVPTAVYKVQ